MANLAIHYGFINGIWHFILDFEETELKPFFDLYPEKFSNKTNGITFRQLMGCNPELAEYLDTLIGIVGEQLVISRTFRYRDNEEVSISYNR